MFDVVVSFVDGSKPEFLDLLPHTLRQVVEAALHVNMVAKDGDDGVDRGLLDVVD